MRVSRLPRLHTLDAWLAYRDFRYLWFGNFFANNAQWLQLLSVGWLVRELSEGSNIAGLLVVTVGGINTLPGLVVGPWGGVLSDRFDRRKLVIVLQTIMAILAFSFALLILFGRVQVWHAYAYVILAGCCHSTVQPMRQALIAGTVPRNMLGNALATNVLTITGTRIIGPFVGGILIFTLGFFWNFTIEACLYLVNIAMIFRVRTPFHRPGDARQRGSALSNMVEGLRYVWSGERAFFQLMILSIIPNIILHPAWFLFPVFTTEVLKRDADVGGYLLAVTGVGGLLAALIMATFGFIFPKGKGCAGSGGRQLGYAAIFRVCEMDDPGIPVHRCDGVQPGGFSNRSRHVDPDPGPRQSPGADDQLAELRSRVPGLGQPGRGHTLRRDVAVDGHGNHRRYGFGRIWGLLGCPGPRAPSGLASVRFTGLQRQFYKGSMMDGQFFNRPGARRARI